MSLKRGILYTFLAQAPALLLYFVSSTLITRMLGDAGRGEYAVIQNHAALLTMLLAGMVLSNLVEEKGNKIIEILAAAIPMDAVTEKACRDNGYELDEILPKGEDRERAGAVRLSDRGKVGMEVIDQTSGFVVLPLVDQECRKLPGHAQGRLPQEATVGVQNA